MNTDNDDERGTWDQAQPWPADDPQQWHPAPDRQWQPQPEQTQQQPEPTQQHWVPQPDPTQQSAPQQPWGSQQPWAPQPQWAPQQQWNPDQGQNQPWDPSRQQQWDPNQQQQWNPNQQQWDPSQQQQWDPSQQQQWPGQQPPPKNRRGLVIGAAAGVALLVGAGTTAFVTLRSDDSNHAARGDFTLGGTYPDAPTQDWEVTAADVEEVAGTSFDDDAQFGYTLDYGDVLVTTLGTYTDEASTLLVAIDTATGTVRWAVPSEGHQSYTCATELVDDLVVCTNGNGLDGGTASELREYSITDGELVDTVRIDGLGNVAVADGALYTSGFDSGGRKGWLTKGTPSDPESDWREEYDFDSCDEPSYGGWLTVAEGVAIHTYIAVSADDGTRISPDGTAATRAGGDWVTVTDCSNLNADGAHEVRLLDRDGTEIMSVDTADNWPASDLTPGKNRPLVIGNTAYDTAQGTELWSAGDDVRFTSVYDDYVLGEDTKGTEDYDDDSMVAFGLTSGERLWDTGITGYSPLFDGSRIITLESTSNDQVVAYDLKTGDEAWSLDVDTGSTVDPAGDGFVVAGLESVAYYPPTG